MIGFLNVKKPSGITSHDLVNQIRSVTGLRRVGHGGTLDPLAQGVMVVALSKACRLIQYLRDDKTYLGEILLGTRTDTDDIDGTILESKSDWKDLDNSEIESKVALFQGKQLQVPPVYSAIKQDGKKLYDLARRGEAPKELNSREVVIHSIEVLSIELPVVKVRVHCSKGTYIRSIARDLGSQLNVGGCLKSLVREQSGTFHLKDAYTVEELKEKNLSDVIVSPVEALGLSSYSIDYDRAKKIAQGQSLTLDDIIDKSELSEQTKLDLKEKLFFLSYQDRPVALVSAKDETRLRPQVVLANADQI